MPQRTRTVKIVIVEGIHCISPRLFVSLILPKRRSLHQLIHFPRVAKNCGTNASLEHLSMPCISSSVLWYNNNEAFSLAVLCKRCQIHTISLVSPHMPWLARLGPYEMGAFFGSNPRSSFSLASYSITQHPLRSFRSPLSKLCLVAASNTSSTPSPVRDEHSKYFLAPILLRTSSPSSGIRNFSLRFRISSCATGSSRRSFFRPTRMMGTPGQRSRTSGCLLITHMLECDSDLWMRIFLYHLVVMLCRESGLETENAIRMTCAWLYASGRSRS